MIYSYILAVVIAISAIYAILVLLKFFKTNKPQYVYWSAGLVAMSVAFVFELYVQFYAWSAISYKIFYFFSSLLVMLLGYGTLYLFNKKKLSLILGLYFLAMGIVFLILLILASVNTGQLSSTAVGGTAITENVVIIGALLIVPASIILIFGSFYKAYQLRKNTGSAIFISLIGLGALVFAGVGSFATFGYYALYYLGQLVGITLMFLGFLKS